MHSLNSTDDDDDDDGVGVLLRIANENSYRCLVLANQSSSLAYL